MRHLATVQTVLSLEPIPNADAIVVARVLGWAVVVKKGQFAVGDRIVYCEIDSLLPERPEFEFLRASSFKPAVDTAEFARPAGFRIKTARLRGQVSQGICLPLDVLPAGTASEIGAVVTDVLGIAKFESPPPVGMGGRVLGGFPGFLPKTDETRIQVLPGVLERYRGAVFGVTEKLDGTSFTAYLRGGRFGVCSRNLEPDPTDGTNLHAAAARRLELDRKMRAFRDAHGFDFAVQGEVIGPGIQGNKYGLRATELRVFNVLDLSAGRLLDRDRQAAAVAELGLTAVPDLGSITLAHTVDELVASAAGWSALNPRTKREGLVVRPFAEVYDADVGGRLSFKVINPQFLLAYDE